MKEIFQSANYQLPKGSRWQIMKFWDLTLGCSPCSIGCQRCSSAKSVYYRNISKVVDLCDGVEQFNGKIIINKKLLSEAKKFEKNEQVFVCGRSDIFHEKIPDDFINKVINVIKTRPDCTFFALTKRPKRFKTFYRFPPNFWVGISVENQHNTDIRLPYFKNVTNIRYASIKPMLGPINLEKHKDYIDAVIVGGEYGPNARPMNKKWVYNIRDWCIKNNKPFSFHNWGLWLPGKGKGKSVTRMIDTNGHFVKNGDYVHTHSDGEIGHYLNGKIWDQYPYENNKK